MAQWAEKGNQLTTTDNVGIGTTSPGSSLDVRGTLSVRGNGDLYFHRDDGFAAGSSIVLDPPGAGTSDLTIQRSGGGSITGFHVNASVSTFINGKVGIGTTVPAFELDVNGDIGVNGVDAIRRDASYSYIFPFGTGTANNVVVIGGGPGGNTGLQVGGVLNVLGDISVSNVDAIRIDGNNAYIFPYGTKQVNNNVVIGGGPGGNTDLQVSGNVRVAGDVLLTGADCAEEFDSASGEPPEPGTVVVINEDGALRESQSAYDKRVAGVVSGAGEYKHGLVLDKRLSQEGRVPVALMGKVYCKVDAQYSPIEVGDLLTTSRTQGHAMKAADPLKAFGAVIGKALKPLKRGQGMIPILIALQ